MMKDSTRELLRPSLHRQSACMIVRPGTGREAEVQADDPSPSRGAMSLQSASRRNANLLEDVVNLQTASAQEDVRNLVSQHVNVPSPQDASNREAEIKPANPATRKWSTSAKAVVEVLLEVQVPQLDLLLLRLATSQCHQQNPTWAVADLR